LFEINNIIYYLTALRMVKDSNNIAHTGTVKSGSTTATISNIPVGSCTVTVTAPDGYSATVSPTSFTMGASGNQDLAVTSSQQSSNSVHVTVINPTCECYIRVYTGKNSTVIDRKLISAGGTVDFDLPELHNDYYIFAEEAPGYGSGAVPAVPNTDISANQVTGGNYEANMQ
jgi:hypothetical protein